MKEKKAYTLKNETKVRRENGIKMTFEMKAGTPVWVRDFHGDGTYFMTKGRDGKDDDPYRIMMINNRAVEGVDFTFKKPTWRPVNYPSDKKRGSK